MLQLVEHARSKSNNSPGLPTTIPISYRHSIAQSAQLVDAFDLFRANPTMRMLPVLDAEEQPIGAIFEQDMRLILFNPFGHALLKNPSYGAHLHGHICPCPTVDASATTEMLIDTFAIVEGHCEGLIITYNGRYSGVISNAVLLQLAATRDAEAAHYKAQRFQRLEEASGRFREEANELAAALVAMSNRLSKAAENMAERASQNGDRAAEVAAAASQAATNMTEVASRGSSLAGTLRAVEQKVTQAQAATRDAAARAAQNNGHTHMLDAAAQKIGEVVSLIDGNRANNDDARAQCYDRGGPRWRAQQGLCRGSGRSEVARSADARCNG